MGIQYDGLVIEKCLLSGSDNNRALQTHKRESEKEGREGVCVVYVFVSAGVCLCGYVQSVKLTVFTRWSLYIQLSSEKIFGVQLNFSCARTNGR